jgi:hypothetical protein
LFRGLFLAAIATLPLGAAAGPFVLPSVGVSERTRLPDTLRVPDHGLVAVVLWDAQCPWCDAQMSTLARVGERCPDHLSLAALRFDAQPDDRRDVERRIPSSFHALIAGPRVERPAAFPEVLVFQSSGRLADSWIGWRHETQLRQLCPNDSSEEIP